ncbi:MAG: hypothetical protein HQL94_02400 [Magnetococcales bacterium]|nr:hypothetical protein [Magnetococcales bacterium]MBF0439367.1 hypothetical protein [Magnetococcales bacterium]
MKTFKWILMTLMLFAGNALADGVLKPAHGGRMVEAEGYRLELLISDIHLDLYVTDHDNHPVAVDKAMGKVTLLTPQGKVESTLSPVGGNQLAANGQFTNGNKSAAVIAVDGLKKRLTARLPVDKEKP